VIGVEEFAINGTVGDYTSNNPLGLDGFETYPSLPAMTLRTNVSYFDTAGRVVGQERKNGPTVLTYSNTEYLGSKTISKPQLGSYQATIVDGLGRTTRVETYNGNSGADRHRVGEPGCDHQLLVLLRPRPEPPGRSSLQPRFRSTSPLAG
jgi:hypothetical protein